VRDERPRFKLEKREGSASPTTTVAVGTEIAHRPRTDPYVRLSTIRAKVNFLAN